MLEIWHTHELNHVCHFVMRLLTWAKRKFEEKGLGFTIQGHHESVSQMWDVVKSPTLRRKTSSITRRHTTKGNGAKGKIFQKGKNLNTSKA